MCDFYFDKIILKNGQRQVQSLGDSLPALAGHDCGLYEGLTVEKVSSDFPEVYLNNREDSLRSSNVKDEGG